VTSWQLLAAGQQQQANTTMTKVVLHSTLSMSSNATTTPNASSCCQMDDSFGRFNCVSSTTQFEETRNRPTRRTVLHVRHNDEENGQNGQNEHHHDKHPHERTTRTIITKPFHLLSHSESTPCNLNDYLKQHPQLVKRARSLKRLSNITTHTTTITTTTTTRCASSSTDATSTATTRPKQRKVINVLQAEVAYAESHQVDWMVSGDATTCHIVGLRSTRWSSQTPTTPSSSSSGDKTVHQQEPLGPSSTLRALTSLAHLDECHLPSLDAMVQEHLQYHCQKEEELYQYQQQHQHQQQQGRMKVEDKTSDEDDFGFFFDAVEELDDIDHDNDDDDHEGEDSTYHQAAPTTTTTTSTIIPAPSWMRSCSMPSTSPTELQHFPGFASSRPFHATPATTDATPAPTFIASTTTLHHSSEDRENNNNNNHDNKQNYNKIQMELHLVGGCDDPASYELSRDLLEAWATLADRYSSHNQVHLVTAAISSLNVKDSMATNDPTTTSSSLSPSVLLSRGMGIDCHTGQVFGLQSIATELQGPAIEVRQARLWARAVTKQQVGGSAVGGLESNRLAVIHTAHSSELCISPFEYCPHPHLEVLLQMPNDVLKNATSTSPELEGEHFCTAIRRTLSWLQLVPSDDVFGKRHLPRRPLRYSRSAVDVHQWVPHDECTQHALSSSQSALNLQFGP
jgi:Protein N-terminal asparagine amidohydrolase